MGLEETLGIVVGAGEGVMVVGLARVTVVVSVVAAAWLLPVILIS